MCNNNKNLSDLDTTIYSQGSRACERLNATESCSCPHPHPPIPPFPPIPPMPPVPPVPPVVNIPTQRYASFYNSDAVGTTYSAGQTIPFPSTRYNTDTDGIINNNGVINLSGGRKGRSYLVNYQVTGIPTAAAIGLAVNGIVDSATISTIPTSTDYATLSGSSIVNVPANTVSNVSVQEVSGTLAAASPTTGTNINIVRIA